MTTMTIEQNGLKYLTFPSRMEERITSDTVADVISECLGANVLCVLADEKHLAEGFFALETLEAGAILQKLRTYGIRFAVVVSPARFRGRRFNEMVTEEKKGLWFSAFTDRRKAEEWLLGL
jgi:hypothetical protein